MATKMVDRNPHTGESLRNKTNNDNYRDHFNATFHPKTSETKEAALRAAPTCRMQGIRVCCGRDDCIHRIKND